MSKKIDFVKSIHGMNENDLKARLEEDKQRLKKLHFAHTISPLENPMTILTSAGLRVIGLSGKMRIHTLPSRFISRVSA